MSTTPQKWAVDQFLSLFPHAKKVDVSWTPRSDKYGAVVYEVEGNDDNPSVAWLFYTNGKIERYF